MSGDHTDLLPSAGRLMSSLRDIGYDAPAAIADLVDNSIDANARAIAIDVIAEGERSYVRVADDGLGLTDRSLDEAMRFGSRRSYGTSDLGAFGLGLKTASLSQARSLTVASRTTAGGRLRIRRWNLDHVIREDRWQLERPSMRDVRPELLQPLRGTRGTVILWEQLDRLIGRPASPHASRTLDALARHAAEHIGMVFHRFLSGEAGGRPVTITVNGVSVEAWDPFARDQPGTRALPLQSLCFEHAGREHAVGVQPHVLPAQHNFTSVEAHARAAGPNRWNRQQGIYIYRRERLIQAGGWNRLRTLDEHSKLARVSLDIPPGADEAFRVNVSKMQVGLPEGLRPQLRAVLAGVVGLAQNVYRQHGAREERPRTRPATPGAASDGWEIGGDWPLIRAAISAELHERPDLADRLLVSLVNARRLATTSEGAYPQAAGTMPSNGEPEMKSAQPASTPAAA